MESIETPRHLVIVLGDQLDLHAAAFDGFDAARDTVWMAEVAEESIHVWSSKSRTALFLTAMRQFAGALAREGRALHYTKLDDPGNRGSLAGELGAAIERLRPQALLMTALGDWRVPYIASGKYIERMSGGSLCGKCCFKPAERTGERACRFTTLYWDFLMRHENRLAANPRNVMQVRNLARVGNDERERIAERAAAIRAGALNAA